MRSISNLPMAALVTVGLMTGGGWLASTANPTTTGAVMPLAASQNTAGAGLNVQIRGVRNGIGNIVVAVYDDAAALAAYSDDIAAYRIVAAKPGTMTVTFPNLTAGPYAVTVHHDENADTSYDDEGWATSGQRDAYDEPPFEQAAVMPGGVALEIFYYD